MVTAQTRHPYAHTLELFRLALLRLPPAFSKEKRRSYEKKLQRFLDDATVKYAEIQKAIVTLGKESWAHRKAYDDVYGRFGRASEEAFLLQHLDAGVREKYEQFIHEGGKLGYVYGVKTEAQLLQPSPFERYFSPEEKFAIEQAWMVARDYARSEIDALVGDAKAGEYKRLVSAFVEQQRQMEDRIADLRRLATVSKKWEPAIADRVRTIEEGWSVVELGADLPELEQEVDYWKGTLAAFLKA